MVSLNGGVFRTNGGWDSLDTGSMLFLNIEYPISIIYPGWWFGCHFLFSHSVGKLIIPTDEFIFFRGVGIQISTSIYRCDVSVKNPHVIRFVQADHVKNPCPYGSMATV